MIAGRSFPAWKAFAFLEDIQVHVVAHVAFRGFLQRLEIPRVIATLTQSLVNDPAARLTFPHLAVETGQIPARLGLGTQACQRALMRGIIRCTWPRSLDQILAPSP